MFEYRAAALLIRTRFPQLILGMQTREELEDVHGVDLDQSSAPAGPPRIVETGVDLPVATAPPARQAKTAAPAQAPPPADLAPAHQAGPEDEEMPELADLPESLRVTPLPAAEPETEPEPEPTIPASAPLAESHSPQGSMPAPAPARAPDPPATREPGDESPEDAAADMMRDRMNRCRTVSGLSRLLDMVDEMAGDLGDNATIIREEIRERQRALHSNSRNPRSPAC